jgi:hypothetical protein
MVRILRNLKIREVASVDRGAGQGCKVVLYKRDGDDVEPDADIDDTDEEAYTAALSYLLHTARGSALLRRFYPRGIGSSADLEGLAQRLAHVIRANSDAAEPSDPHMPWLDVVDDEETEPETETETETEKVHMDREEVLKSMVRAEGGITGLCRSICKRGAQGVTEHELTELITEYAMREYPDMSAEGAFTKAYTSAAGETLRRAIGITNGMLEPTKPVVGEDVDPDDASKAYKQLQRLAEEQRARAPFLSAAQAFERAGRARPDLLRRATSQ